MCAALYDNGYAPVDSICSMVPFCMQYTTQKKIVILHAHAHLQAGESHVIVSQPMGCFPENMHTFVCNILRKKGLIYCPRVHYATHLQWHMIRVHEASLYIRCSLTNTPFYK